MAVESTGFTSLAAVRTCKHWSAQRPGRSGLLDLDTATIPLIPTGNTIVDLSGLSGLIEADPAARTARFWAGTKIKTVGQVLGGHGLGLHNQGDIDEQAIAGATSTGTHGTGRDLQSFSASVKSTTLVTASGAIQTIGPNTDDPLFRASQLSLGALGVALDVTLDVREAYRLKETSWFATYAEIRPLIEELTEAHRHFEFFWLPTEDRAHVKIIDETTNPPEYPVGAEGERTAWSYEVFPSHRPHLHTEMEFAVPRSVGPSCLDALKRIFADSFSAMAWPIEYRTQAADDVWLSTAYQRDIATLSVHHPIGESDEPFFRACEEVFRSFDGRPHWGKMHYFTGPELAAVHPRWADWIQARDSVDPERRFLNDRLAELFA